MIVCFRLVLINILLIFLLIGCAGNFDFLKSDGIDHFSFPESMVKSEPAQPITVANVKPDRGSPSLKPGREKSDQPSKIKEETIGLVVKPDLPGAKSRVRKIMVVGDSLSVGIGTALTDMLKGKKGLSVNPRGKVGSGLNSPKFYNWDEKLQAFLAAEKPDALVVMIGGNDAFNGAGTNNWAESFKEKAEKFLKIAAQNKVMVFWVGLPVMKEQNYSSKVKVANQAMASVCQGSENCTFVDTWKISPEYSGMRAGDGIHFTFAGYKLLGHHILQHMAKKMGIEPTI